MYIQNINRVIDLEKRKACGPQRRERRGKRNSGRGSNKLLHMKQMSSKALLCKRGLCPQSCNNI